MKISAKTIPMLATAVVLVVLYLAGLYLYGAKGFGDAYVLSTLLMGQTPIAIAAIGATFVILSGGIDLSIGSVIGFTTMFLAWIIMDLHYHPVIAIPAALLVGAAVGAAMGTLIHVYKIPAFMVTLAGLFFMRGMAFYLGTASVTIDHEMFPWVRKHLLLAFDEATLQSIKKFTFIAIPLARRPYPTLRFETLAFLFFLAAAIFVLHFTRFGRSVYALGDDENSARLMGVKIGPTKVAVYSLAGFFSALAGVATVFSSPSGDPNAAVGMELSVIAAVVIGGTLLTGGVGYVAGTFMGVLILGLIPKLLYFNGNANSAWTAIVTGGLLFVFILLQNMVVLLARRAAALSRQRSTQ